MLTTTEDGSSTEGGGGARSTTNGGGGLSVGGGGAGPSGNTGGAGSTMLGTGGEGDSSNTGGTGSTMLGTGGAGSTMNATGGAMNGTGGADSSGNTGGAGSTMLGTGGGGDSSNTSGATSGTGGAGSTMNATGGAASGGAASGGAASGGAASGGAASGGAASGGGTPTGTVLEGQATCAGLVYQCGDGLDNDGDTLIDSADPDCLGSCDNTEDSYFSALFGQLGPPCIIDCYWDPNSGAGNDECYWSHQCDPYENIGAGSPEPASLCPYDPGVNIPGTSSSCGDLMTTQPDQCGTTCGPLTPNGCDCFGCCELPAGSGLYVWLGSRDETTGEGSCTEADVLDPTRCEPCTPVQDCLNECEECELCIGKASQPASCTPGTGQCPAGAPPCGLPGQAPCAAGSYCITGCCQAVP